MKQSPVALASQLVQIKDTKLMVGLARIQVSDDRIARVHVASRRLLVVDNSLAPLLAGHSAPERVMQLDHSVPELEHTPWVLKVSYAARGRCEDYVLTG